MRYPLKNDREPGEICGHPALSRNEKENIPMVMMLEPLHACNLTCTGCGRIREYKSTINEVMTVEQCMAASDECGAPIVSICGGEADDLSGNWQAGARDSGTWTAHHSVHEWHVYPQAAA